jgi:hypothetical protein
MPTARAPDDPPASAAQRDGDCVPDPRAGPRMLAFGLLGGALCWGVIALAVGLAVR